MTDPGGFTPEEEDAFLERMKEEYQAEVMEIYARVVEEMKAAGELPEDFPI